MYLLIKTSSEEADRCGSLFEAARGHWDLNPENASKCSHAIVAFRGEKDIKGVYKIDKWYPSTLVKGRYVFAGEPDNRLKNLVGKKLRNNLLLRGRKNPISYVKEYELLES